jgi:hypothetical protein
MSIKKVDTDYGKNFDKFFVIFSEVKNKFLLGRKYIYLMSGNNKHQVSKL